MNPFDSYEELFGQTGTWDANIDSTLDFGLLPHQPLTQHLQDCPTQYQDVGECLYCNFDLSSGGQGQVTLPQGPQQYGPHGHRASHAATDALTWTQANAPLSQQYSLAQPSRSSWSQQAPSRRSNVASGTSTRQSQVLFETDMRSNYSAGPYRSTSMSLPASHQAQQYYNTSSAARQANAASLGRTPRSIPSTEGFMRPAIPQPRPGFNRLSLQPTTLPTFQSQLSSGLPLSTDYQAPSTNSASHIVTGWVTQPRVPGERSTIPTTPQQFLQPIPQSSPISENSSSGTSRRRGAAEMRQIAGEFQHQCTQCHKTYPKAGELSKHEKRCHGDPNDRPHACTVHGCTRRFNYPREVRRHVASKHEETNEYFCHHHDCRFARKGFPRSDHLERHLRTKHRRVSAQVSVSMSRTSSSQTY